MNNSTQFAQRPKHLQSKRCRLFLSRCSYNRDTASAIQTLRLLRLENQATLIWKRLSSCFSVCWYRWSLRRPRKTGTADHIISHQGFLDRPLETITTRIKSSCLLISVSARLKHLPSLVNLRSDWCIDGVTMEGFKLTTSNHKMRIAWGCLLKLQGMS